MNILGIIVEYNPFHNGHLYHLSQAKTKSNAQYTIAVMSGHFTQRGLPASLDKYTRTRLALLGGVDVVLEIPTPFSIASANYFASGAVSVLNHTPVTHLVFGSETNDIDELKQYAHLLNNETPAYKFGLQKFLAQGFSYPHAREKAFSEIFSADACAVFRPNNTLGIEYLRALDSIKSGIIPLTLQRNNNLQSATSINAKIKKCELSQLKNEVPHFTYESLINANFLGELVSLDDFSAIFQFVLKNPYTDFNDILDFSSELHKRLIKSAGDFYKLSDILLDVKSKNYTLTRLQRAALHLLLGITKTDVENFLPVPYVRVLGFKKESAFLLKEIKAPLLTNPKNAPDILSPVGLSLFEKEVFATDLYYMARPSYKNNPQKKGIEYSTPLVII